MIPAVEELQGQQCVFNQFFEMKMKYEESDDDFIWESHILTDKTTGLLGGLFSKMEMSEVLTEILRVDPAFDKDRFLQQCENDIIPNVLEVGVRHVPAPPWPPALAGAWESCSPAHTEPCGVA